MGQLQVTVSEQFVEPTCNSSHDIIRSRWAHINVKLHFLKKKCVTQLFECMQDWLNCIEAFDTCLIFVCGCANAVSETVPFLLQFFGKRHPFYCNFLVKKHAVFLANFAEMYPFFFNKIAENWHLAPKILRIVVK